MAQNTRLKEVDRTNTIASLTRILNHVPQCIEMPVRDKRVWGNLWNSKFPQMLFTAMQVCTDYGYEPNVCKYDTLRFVVEQEGKLYSTPIMLRWLPGDPPERTPIQMSGELRAAYPGCLEQVRADDGEHYLAMQVSRADLEEHLGVEHTEQFYEWITSTSLLRKELLEAHQTINDLFTMAKTAGQIKRMVPDLLQYLPMDLRRAYESQIRASSLPFEWAPYPKDRVERMIVAVGKGHLLGGMAKEGQRSWDLKSLDSCMWGVEVDII